MPYAGEANEVESRREELSAPVSGWPMAGRAVIDIGSNTVRLVVFGGPPRAPTVLHNEKVTAKLGRDLAETGLIPDKAMDAALTALARYRVLLEGLQITEVDVVATAAARDASNGAMFLDRVRQLGLDPRLLSGTEEAEISASGVLAAFPGASGVVADLGGGSLELVDIADDQSQHGVSLPLGTLRLVRLREQGPRKFADRLDEVLSGSGWSTPAGQGLYLVGGSFRAFARYAINVLAWPLKDAHAFELDIACVEQLIQSAGKAPGLRPSLLAGISPARAASLPDAVELLRVLARHLQPTHVTFSSWGLREGLLYRRLEPHARGQHPLVAGVAAFAQPLHASATLAERVAAWTAPASLEEDRSGEPVRLAATILALAAVRIEPNLRARHALDWALHKRWIGIDSAGRAMLAATLLGSAGKLDPPDDLLRLGKTAQLEQALVWGLAIRVCRRLTAYSERLLLHTALRRAGSRIVLELDGAARGLMNEASRRDLETLAERMGLEADVVIRPATESPRSPVSGTLATPLAP